MLKETQKKVSGKSEFPQRFKQQILSMLKKIQTSFREEEYANFLDDVSQLSFLTKGDTLNNILSPSNILLIKDHLKAMQGFIYLKKTEDIRPQGIGFLAICIYNLMEILTRKINH